ncbi:MAG: hypothetical protein ABL952_12945 [Pyrinomonadaceae bacterium]
MAIGAVAQDDIFSPTGGSATTTIVRDGSVDPTFRLFAGQHATGTVNALAKGPGNTLYVAGFLLSINGAPVPHVARLNPDGSVDSTFNVGSGPNITVTKLFVQQDGKVLISGLFSSVNGVARNGTARLNTDGSLDSSFPQIVSNTSSVRLDFCGVEPDDDIFVCGDFTMVNGVARSGMARLTSSGMVDQTFSIGSGFGPSQSSSLFAVTPVDGGKLLLGGFFTTINGVARNGIARLNPDGSLDQTFVLDGSLFLGTPIVSIQPLGGGRILVAGTNRLARIFADGSRDPAFANDLTFSSNARFAISQTDGKIIVGGSFNEVQSGSLDQSYLQPIPFPQTQNSDSTFLNTGILSQDGKIITGGFYTSSPGKAMLRVNSDGSLDNDFRGNVLTRALVFTGLLEPDGKILVGGTFHYLGSTARPQLGRLNVDGTVDATFVPGVNFRSVVYSVIRQPDGKYLVGGYVDHLENPSPAVWRLMPDGSLDTSFTSPILNSSSYVYSMALQPDGRIIIGGSFNTVNGVERRSLARLNQDGSLDSMTVPIQTFSGGIDDIFIQPSGKIVIAGSFQGPSGSGIGGIARVNADGTLDPSFTANFGGFFSSVKSLSRIGDDFYVGGSINFTGGGSKQPPVKMDQDGRVDMGFSANFTEGHRVSPLNDSKLLIAGKFQAFAYSGRRYSIARILSNGGIDNTFDAGPFVTNLGQFQESVYEAFPLSQGKIFASGIFDSIAGEPRLSMVRLDINRPVTRVINDFDADAKVDPSVFRPSDGTWRLLRSTMGMYNITLGATGDRMVPGDYDGDGVTDAGVYRPAEGRWYVAQSSNGVITTFTLGTSNDFATPGDFDGDGRTDYAIFRPSNGQWTIVRTSDGTTLNTTLGQAGDLPVIGDYDGDRRADIGVFRPSTATWHLQRSTAGDFVFQFGNSSDRTVHADYDGDGLTDLGMFRRSDATWRRYFMGPQTSDAVAFGDSTDLPVAGDYDGDGRADIAMYRPSTSRWFIKRTLLGDLEVLFGSPGDSPIPNAFVYSAGLEGDIGPRPMGEGQIQTNDVVQARRFVAGLDTVTTGMNEFQRADTSPRATFGDGVMSAADVVQARRYASGLDPLTDAAGPGLAALRSDFSLFGNVFPDIWIPGIHSRSELRIVPKQLAKPNQISFPIELITDECPTAMSFTLEYNSAQLSNPRVFLGSGLVSEAALTQNVARKGLVAIVIDSTRTLVPCVATERGPKEANVVLTVTFDTSSRYRRDFAAVRFSNRIAPISLSDSSGVDLPIFGSDKWFR